MKTVNAKWLAFKYKLAKKLNASIENDKNAIKEGAKITFEDYCKIQKVECSRKSYSKEIQQELEKLSSKYKSFANTDDLNLVRIKAQLEKDVSEAGIFTSKKKKEKYNELISAVDGTIQHEKDFEKYTKGIDGFEMTDQMKNIFNETTVKNEIREHRKSIMNRTGIIIDKINDDIIEHNAEVLKKEVKAKAKVINDQVETMCTEEEKIKVEEFAKTIGLSVKEAIAFLRQEDSVYPCLFTRLFGHEVLSKIDDNNAEAILTQIDPEWEFKKNRVAPAASRLYTKKEDTKPQITAKQYQLKIPPKK